MHSIAISLKVNEKQVSNKALRVFCRCIMIDKVENCPVYVRVLAIAAGFYVFGYWWLLVVHGMVNLIRMWTYMIYGF